MKKLIILSVMVSTNAFALDFDKEWSAFAKDFSRLKEVKMAKVAPVSTSQLAPVESRVLPATNTQSNVLERVDPNSSERLGFKLKDPAMRKYLQELYKKPDTVVYSLTLTE